MPSAATVHLTLGCLQPPPIHLPHLNPRQHLIPEHPQIHPHPVERPFRQRQPVRRAAANADYGDSAPNPQAYPRQILKQRGHPAGRIATRL
mgnify:CR=1 FL=1